MKYKITAPGRISASLDLPSSKSICNRALIINALSEGKEDLLNISDCDDTQVLVEALKTMPQTIDIGATGTAMRFLTAYLAGVEGERILTGSKRMLERPIKVLVEALRRLGADIEYEGEEGFPPLRIRGKRLMGGTLQISASVSSQYISALLMTGPKMWHGLCLELTGEVVSRPYIDLTLMMMRDFGAKAQWLTPNIIKVERGDYKALSYTVENDWSAASYWYEMLALCPDCDSELTLHGLQDVSLQGDSAVRYLFNMLGVKTQFQDKTSVKAGNVCLQKSVIKAPRLDYDFSNQPDLVQTMAVTCALMGKPFRFTGLGTLRIKETDRIAAIIKELGKLGYILSDEGGDVLVFNGERHEVSHPVEIETYKDHRMAMAFAPAALVVGEVVILDPMVVTKSYPHFWEDMRRVGFSVKEI